MTGATLLLIETTISEKTVRLRFTNDSDTTKATEWIDVQVDPGEYVLGNLKLPEGRDRMPLAAIQIAALKRAKARITAEETRLSKLVGQSS